MFSREKISVLYVDSGTVRFLNVKKISNNRKVNGTNSYDTAVRWLFGFVPKILGHDFANLGYSLEKRFMDPIIPTSDEHLQMTERTLKARIHDKISYDFHIR